jgi:nucleotide-binding universal stress UspA family protein
MVERILVAVGDTEHADDVADLAGVLARTYYAHVLVFHVWEWYFPLYRGNWAPAETPAEARALVNHVVGALRSEGVEAVGRVVAAPRGNAARAIVDEAHRMEANLIVMGSRGPSSWAALWNGSVAQRVIHCAHCPVTVARERDRVRRPLRRHHPAAAH